MSEKIAVIGLGYVGLPVAVALGKVFDGVVGFDINETRVEALQDGYDLTNEVAKEDLQSTHATFSHNIEAIKDASFYIVTVPTPVDEHQRPDLRPLESVCKTIGPHLKKNDIVVFESTVYPGVTENYCAPILESFSGLASGQDFFLGYSPERINPGDKTNSFETIVKIISAQDESSLARVRNVYGAVVKAGLYEAPSIKVAEAAKVIENVQRDVNIALMNELAMIFHRVGIRTKDVLDAAGSKWNFLKFTPGLVGGHCIGIDPYYLTSEAERLGYYPHLIRAGRRINDGMGVYIVEQIIKKMIDLEMPIKNAKIGILGLTFKENVPDLRNSRVADIIGALHGYGLNPIVHDPHADRGEAQREYGVDLTDIDDLKDLDVLIIAVLHDEYKALGASELQSMIKDKGLLVDIKSAYEQSNVPSNVFYWSL